MRLQKIVFLFAFILLFSFTLVPKIFASDPLAFSPLDLNGNGINDADEPDVVLSASASLPAGVYSFNNLTITNNATLTLDGDPSSLTAFKGVTINTVNLKVDPGSSISSYAQGYGYSQGPGASTENSIGASYGGFSYSGKTFSTTYGSATKPTDLGSGGVGHGGGAIILSVSDTFYNDGIVSSDGGDSSSGGSIYLTAGSLRRY